MPARALLQPRIPDHGLAFPQRRVSTRGTLGCMRNYLSRASMQVLLGLVVVAVLAAAAWLAVAAPHLQSPYTPPVAPVFIQHIRGLPSPHPA